nr:putative zinc finger, CCHC-type, Caulimovirus coat protein [Tanacetum cinerariifolium]
MKPKNKVFSITYLVAYALTSSHHSIDYKKKEYIKIDDLFNEIGSVEGSKFAAIKPIDESWAIDIAKNKRLIGEEPSRSSVHIKRNRLHIRETSSDIRQSMNQRMEEPTTESDSEEEQTPKIEKINRVKIERRETSNKKRSYEFRMPLHKGIPNKNSSSSQAINILNLDCISDLNERKRILEKWSTEISLILQTNKEDFQTAKSVLTLIEHKTEGNIQSLVKQAQWNEDLHRIDFFDSVIDVLYTMFVGIDYH